MELLLESTMDSKTVVGLVDTTESDLAMLMVLAREMLKARQLVPVTETWMAHDLAKGKENSMDHDLDEMWADRKETWMARGTVTRME